MFYCIIWRHLSAFQGLRALLLLLLLFFVSAFVLVPQARKEDIPTLLCMEYSKKDCIGLELVVGGRASDVYNSLYQHSTYSYANLTYPCSRLNIPCAIVY